MQLLVAYVKEIMTFNLCEQCSIILMMQYNLI